MWAWQNNLVTLAWQGVECFDVNPYSQTHLQTTPKKGQDAFGGTHFFTEFNEFGTMRSMYIYIYTTYKFIKWWDQNMVGCATRGCAFQRISMI